MSRSPPRKLTESYVKGLGYDGTVYAVRDTAVTGLFVEVHKTCKSYKVQRDLWVGERGRRRLAKTVRVTLGVTDELSLDEARTKAMQLVARIRRGEDPNAVPDDHCEAATWTVERMFDEYAKDMRARECAERSIKDMLYRKDLYLPDWQSIPIQLRQVPVDQRRTQDRLGRANA